MHLSVYIFPKRKCLRSAVSCMCTTILHSFKLCFGNSWWKLISNPCTHLNCAPLICPLLFINDQLQDLKAWAAAIDTKSSQSVPIRKFGTHCYNKPWTQQEESNYLLMDWSQKVNRLLWIQIFCLCHWSHLTRKTKCSLCTMVCDMSSLKLNIQIYCVFKNIIHYLDTW